MSRHFKLDLPQPCHEKWHEMSPQEKGRFCSSCETVVYDLRAKTPEQIREIYQEKKGKLCGVVPKDLIAEHGPSTSARFSRRFLCAVILCFGTSLFALDARGEVYVQEVLEQTLPIPAETADADLEIRGQVRDFDTGKPLAAATVKVEVETPEGKRVFNSTAGSDGDFSIALDVEMAQLNRGRLIVIMAGYKTVERYFYRYSFEEGKLNIDMYLKSAFPSVVQNKDNEGESSSSLSSKLYIQGKISDDESGEELPFVNIYIQGLNIGTTSDFDGNYQLEVPAGIFDFREHLILKVSFVGYETVTHLVRREDIAGDVVKADFNMADHAVMLGMVVMVPGKPNSPRRMFWKAKTLGRRAVYKLNPFK